MLFNMDLHQYRLLREKYYLSQGLEYEDAEFEALGDVVLATQKDTWKIEEVLI